MRYVFAVIILSFVSSLAMGFTDTVPVLPATTVPDFKYFRIAEVNISGDADLNDANLSWHDVNAQSGHTRWFKKPDGWTWVQFQFYFWGDGNDPNSGQADVNILGAKTFGSTRILLSSTIKAGNERMSHDPYTGIAYRTGAIPDANYKWVNADANYVAGSADTDIGRSGYSGTTSTPGCLTYSFDGLDKFYCVRIKNVSPANKISHVYCVMTGGK